MKWVEDIRKATKDIVYKMLREKGIDELSVDYEAIERRFLKN